MSNSHPLPLWYFSFQLNWLCQYKGQRPNSPWTPSLCVLIQSCPLTLPLEHSRAERLYDLRVNTALDVLLVLNRLPQIRKLPFYRGNCDSSSRQKQTEQSTNKHLQFLSVASWPCWRIYTCCHLLYLLSLGPFPRMCIPSDRLHGFIPYNLDQKG